MRPKPFVQDPHTEIDKRSRFGVLKKAIAFDDVNGALGFAIAFSKVKERSRFFWEFWEV